MARRATVIAEKRAQKVPQLLVDTGNFVHGKSSVNLLQAEYLTKAMSQMGYDAINVGREEMVMGFQELLGLRDRQRMPLVSSNVMRREGKRHLVLPYIIERVGASHFMGFPYGGLKVALIGLTMADEKDPLKRLVPKELLIEDPLETLATTLEKLRPHCDLVLVLSDIDLETAQGLANRVPGIDLFFIGSGARTKYVEETAGTIFAYPARKGDELGDIELLLDEQNKVVSHQVEWTLLDDKIPDDPQMAQLVMDFKEAQQELRKASQKIKK